ncbi:MAG: hypothetical protein QOE70_1703 [Chthoniobacter sp.]|jgi:hypothetical protein|nr:hypothetical protein [Chthoniobacter sp.]
MKNLSKLPLVVVAVTLLGSAASFGDDPQLQNRLPAQRAKSGASQKSTTVGVYVHDRSVGRQEARRAQNPEQLRLMRQDVPQGSPIFYFAPER